VVTGNGTADVCHIYPHSLIRRGANDPLTQEFWRTMYTFWPEEKVQLWFNTIFPSNNPSGIETCKNLIYLDGVSHRLWGDAKFALRPLESSGDDSVLELEFNWLRQYSSTPNRSYFDLLTVPRSNEGMAASGDEVRAPSRLFSNQLGRLIRTGDVLKITTTDLVRLPLPSRELLEMQWLLTQVAAMSGAAEDEEVRASDDEDDDLPIFWLDD
jgi:hypothetical protein